MHWFLVDWQKVGWPAGRNSSFCVIVKERIRQTAQVSHQWTQTVQDHHKSSRDFGAWSQKSFSNSFLGRMTPLIYCHTAILEQALINSKPLILFWWITHLTVWTAPVCWSTVTHQTNSHLQLPTVCLLMPPGIFVLAGIWLSNFVISKKRDSCWPMAFTICYCFCHAFFYQA